MLRETVLKLMCFLCLAGSAGLAQGAWIEEPNQEDLGEGQLTIFAYPPSGNLVWDNPRNVFLSFAKIELERRVTRNSEVQFLSPYGESGSLSSNYRSTMGHAIVRVQCQLPGGDWYKKWVSFSGQNYAEIDKKNILQDKIGLGVLFYDYPDGHLIEGAENISRITHYKGPFRKSERGYWEKVRPRYLKVSLSQQQCGQLAEYVDFFAGFHFSPHATLEELLQRPAEKILYFNANIDPLAAYEARKTDPMAKVGGGCAPFAISLLKLIGRYQSVFDQALKLKVPVSEKLIGRADRKVSVSDLLFTGLGSSWTHPGDQAENTRWLNLYDPYKIWQFIGDLRQCLTGKDCPAEASEFLQAQPGQLIMGAPVHFRDSYQVLVPTNAPRGYIPGPPQKITKKAHQLVEGVLWH
jgi:hypothetical protein